MSDLRCGLGTGLRWLAVLAVILAFAPSVRAELEEEHLGHDRDKILIQSSKLAPNPVTPPGQTTLSTIVAVRKVSGLGGFDRDDLADADEDHGQRCDSKEFLVDLRWTIKNANGSTLRQLAVSAPVQPPLHVVRLKTRGGSAPFVLVPVNLTWNVRDGAGVLAHPGTYAYSVEADFVRVHHLHNHRTVRLIDKSDPVLGTVTVKAGGVAPAITLTSPTEGLLTRSKSLVVSGSISGTAPVTVTVNGVATPVTNGSFSLAIHLVEGANLITVTATNALGSASVTRHVQLDDIPPSIIVSKPPTGSVTSSPTPLIEVDYADVGGSGCNTASFAADIDGVHAAFTVGATKATFVPATPLKASTHVVHATISDLAGNTASAQSQFTVIGGGTAPGITLTSPTEGLLTRNKSLVVSGSISGTAPITVTVNGIAAPLTNGSFSLSITLAEGANLISVTATNTVGSASVTRHVQLDDIPPSIVVSQPPTGSTTTNPTPLIEVDYADVGGSGCNTASFAADIDGVAATASFTVGATKATLVPVTPLSPSNHVVHATISDLAGNTASAQSQFTIVARSAPPSVSAYPTTTNVPVLTLSGSKPANSSILVDHIVRLPTTAGTTWTTTQTIPREGLNTFEVSDQVSGQLESASVTVNVTLLTVPPAPPTVVAPPTDVTTPGLTLTGTKTPGTGVLISGVLVVPINNSTTWSATVTLAPGDNQLLVETVDVAGNKSITQGGQIAGVQHQKPVISPLTVSPAIAPTGTPVSIGYKLFTTGTNDLHVVVSIEDGSQLVRTVFDGIQQGSATGLPYTQVWDQKTDAGVLAAINTSYKVVVSADHTGSTTEPLALVDANPKESGSTITGSQTVASADGRLRVIFRPDDAKMSIASSPFLSAKQMSILAARGIRPITAPYVITVDRPFTSPVVGVFTFPKPVGRRLRPFSWDPVMQDWIPISRSSWNAEQQALGFAIAAQGVIMIGSTPDADPPRLATITIDAKGASIRATDLQSGINSAKTRVRCHGTDITHSTTTKNLNGSHDQLLTTSDPGAATNDLLIYLEDWSGNGRLHRIPGGRR